MTRFPPAVPHPSAAPHSPSPTAHQVFRTIKPHVLSQPVPRLRPAARRSRSLRQPHALALKMDPLDHGHSLVLEPLPYRCPLQPPASTPISATHSNAEPRRARPPPFLLLAHSPSTQSYHFPPDLGQSQSSPQHFLSPDSSSLISLSFSFASPLPSSFPLSLFPLVATFPFVSLHQSSSHLSLSHSLLLSPSPSVLPL